MLVLKKCSQHSESTSNIMSASSLQSSKLDNLFRIQKNSKYKYKQIPNTIQEKYGMNTHFAKLNNLDADENYYFVIKDSKGVSERYWFKTAPDKPKPLWILIYMVS